MLSETGPSTSNAEQSRVDDVDTRAIKLLGEGKRNLLVGDAPSAVVSLQEACEILAAKYGEISDQCADPYYHYGNALLELGRMESGVLGNALDGVPEGAATDTDDETTTDDTANKFEKANKLEDTGVGTTDMGEVADSATEDDEESEEDSANDTADENKEVNPDDVPNFQLAWEMLELARVIFSRKEDKDYKLKVAQVHFKLGELGLETEQYAQSLEDFSICLNIQKSHLEPESRLIAGSHYNLGLAYSFDSKMDKAMENFTAAKKVIEDRITKLEKDVKDKEEKKEENYEEAVNKMKKEITELQELTPDVLAKIDDAKESRDQSVSETSSSFDQPSSSASSFSAPVTIQVKRKPDAAPVADISHLVKRKRTDNDSSSTVEETTDSKRTKQEGDGDAKQVNGNTEAGKDTKKSDAAMET